MRLPDDTTAYSHKWKYVETAYWGFNPATKKYGLLRDGTGKKGERVATFLEWDSVQPYADKHDCSGIYTSIFRFNEPSLDSITLGNLYFDLDKADEMNLAQADAIKLCDYFTELTGDPDCTRAYFTGKKGFHIEVEAMALGITPSNSLAGTYRFIANDLKEELSLQTIDFAVYDRRRMWRLPNTRHQTTNLYKIPLSYNQLNYPIENIKKLALEPQDSFIPEQKFSMKGNEWYREYTYKIEEAKKPQYTAQDLIERFNKHGTGVLKNVGESSREFNPKKLLENCHAITDLWEKAETKHHLEHEERLFLLSILSYTDESLFYLHEILRNCNDYNFEKSQSHIDDWIRRREMGIGGRPYTCRRANEAGVGCGDCNLEVKKKWARVGDSLIETDEEAPPSPIRFAYDYNRRSNG